MSLENSPTLEEVGDGTPIEKPDNKGLRYTLVGIAVLVVILLGVLFLQSDGFAVLAGQGAISGYAVNEAGEPVAVEVLVFGTELIVFSDDQGYFEVENIPAGERSVIVVYDLIGVEEIVVVRAGENVDMGTVVVPTEEEVDY